MLTIIITIITVLGILKFLCFLSSKIKNDMLAIISGIIGFFIIFISILFGILTPISGFNDWKLQSQTELVSLSNSTTTGSKGSFFYVSRSTTNVYTFRYEINSEFGTDTSTNYQTDTIEENVVEIEDPKCKVPVLKVYKRTGKLSIWTFGICEEIKNVFYVPEGTIGEELNLE